MSRSICLSSIALIVGLDISPLRADTPSTASAAPYTVEHGELTTLFAHFEHLQRGTLRFAFGAVDYHLAREGLNVAVRGNGTATRATVGFNGDRRIELGWQMGGATLTVALTEQGERSGYRIEIMREF